MGMIHGVIPTATDLAPTHIWEECDLTILFFQRPIPVCSSPRPGLKHASVPGEGEREAGRNRGREIVERVKLCVCLSLIACMEEGRSLSFQSKSKHGQHYSSCSLSVHDIHIHLYLICTAASQTVKLLNQK